MRIELREYLSIGVLVLALGAEACGGSKTPATPTPAPSAAPTSLSGTVTDGGTGKGVANATVAFLDGPNAGQSATTDADGVYSFTAVTTGNANLKASALSYGDAISGLYVNGSSTLDFKLQKRSVVVGSDGDVAANGGYGVAVHLLTLHPAAGATIRPLFNWSGPNFDPAQLDYVVNHCGLGDDDPQNSCYKYDLELCNHTGTANRVAAIGFAASATGPVLIGVTSTSRGLAIWDIPATGCMHVIAPDNRSGGNAQLNPFSFGGVSWLVVDPDQGNRYSYPTYWVTAQQ